MICCGLTYSQTSLNVHFLFRTALTIETCLGLDTKQLHQLLHDEFANLHIVMTSCFQQTFEGTIYMINGIKHGQKRMQTILTSRRARNPQTLMVLDNASRKTFFKLTIDCN